MYKRKILKTIFAFMYWLLIFFTNFSEIFGDSDLLLSFRKFENCFGKFWRTVESESGPATHACL